MRWRFLHSFLYGKCKPRTTAIAGSIHTEEICMFLEEDFILYLPSPEYSALCSPLLPRCSSFVTLPTPGMSTDDSLCPTHAYRYPAGNLLMKCHRQHRKDRSIVQASIREKGPQRIGCRKINTNWQRGPPADFWKSLLCNTRCKPHSSLDGS